MISLSFRHHFASFSRFLRAVLGVLLPTDLLPGTAQRPCSQFDEPVANGAASIASPLVVAFG